MKSIWNPTNLPSSLWTSLPQIRHHLHWNIKLLEASKEARQWNISTKHSQQCARFIHNQQSAQHQREPPLDLSQAWMSRITTRDHRKIDGDTNWKKWLDTIWLVLQNVDSIPNNIKGGIKLDCLHAFTLENDIDILALTELNTTWDQLEYKDQLPAKTCGWWEANQWSMSNNKQDTHGDD